MEWSCNNGVKYDITCVKLGVRLTNMNINGISKGKHTKCGWTKIFNFIKLKKMFNIDNLTSI